MDAVTVTSWARLIPYLITLLFGGCLTACSSLNPQPPIEAFANKLADQPIIPAVKQGLAQGVEQLSIQAGAQCINPTYAVNFEGKWVVGIEGRASVGVEGVAGQLQISSASGDKTQTSPNAKNRANADSGDAQTAENGTSTADSGKGLSPSPASTPSETATRPATFSVRIYDADRDEGKGFARLEDGTLVVVFGAADKLGQTVAVEVTGIAASPAGRLVTAKLAGGR